MNNFAKKVIEVLKAYEITYGDVRVQNTTSNYIMADGLRLEQINHAYSCGFGVRVLLSGHWGFAASPVMNDREIEKTVSRARNMALQAFKVFGKGEVILTEGNCVTGKFETPYEIDPFEVPLDEKTDFLLSLNEGLLGFDKKIKRARSFMFLDKINKIFASTEGTFIDISFLLTHAEMEATSTSQNDFKTRSFRVNPRSMGYENIVSVNMKSHTERVASEAIRHLSAKSVSSGKKDLILDPQHLALVIHESVGHPTELDRVLGYEMSLAGESFATIDKLNNFCYGSPIVNFVADNTLKGGLATTGYDDEGVRCTKWDVIKDGILKGYSTSRETAGFINQRMSNGTCRADSWASVPIVRIPNLSLMPGKERLSLDDLIADTKDGILIKDRGSFSIDQRRLNFQFGGDAFWEIKNGKITGMLKDVTYQALTHDFWNSCDAICDERFWEPSGIISCGKGDPCQIARMTHGASPARFRNINVG